MLTKCMAKIFRTKKIKKKKTSNELSRDSCDIGVERLHAGKTIDLRNLRNLTKETKTKTK